MRYLSTRDPKARAGATFTEILLEGLAGDGGLYLPQEYPRVDAATLARWRQVLHADGYAMLAYEVVRLFVDDIPEAQLRDICARTYTAEAFGGPQIVPVRRLSEDIWLGHLSNGPTAAFKDLAMQLLGTLFEYELARRDTSLTILGATSGDTGSAAEHAMLGKERVTVFMLTPRGRATEFQQAQMFSVADPHIVNITVDGVFDDCQDLVKAVNADAEFKRRWNIGAVNSINWARLLAQVVYYVACWLRVSSDDTQRVSICVPSGNFGNICAGHIARQMGLPIEHLVLATNENNVLEEFFRTGVYRVRGAAETYATSSPSMDISKASNFERFAYDLLGRDGARVATLFGEQLPSTGQIDLSAATEFRSASAEFGFVAGSSTHADRLRTIAAWHREAAVLVDPHTADGLKVAGDYLNGALPVSGDGPVIVLETALPVKFSAAITEAIGHPAPVPEKFAHLLDLPRHTVPIGNDAEELKALIAGTLGTS